ncbi:ATP-dependent RNA helicase HrpA [Thiomicrorhabdus aquaedulcis]|uniref:ATP-dependent RNA helicase HrpA n=1 Tax=Thiomicrorhabdus aquaedulcis TaxID=2211106 RepID=UPI001E28B6C1|nr:ATP-dependent RNA helicase HrpA [Thiomicrorhabdus aquaedulcis]
MPNFSPLLPTHFLDLERLFTDATFRTQQLAMCLCKDRFRLTQALNKLSFATLKPTDQAWLDWQARVQASQAAAQLNQQAIPSITYDDALPVAAKRDELMALIRQHQVVVIAGETGSGKTTQIPKICLEAGRGVFGRIGCTQPRRLAARSVSERIAQELGSNVGELVGYQVRFMDQVHAQSVIKVMTDGILLAEVQNDRYLSQYDTIIIDEAHERSINIDFLLGILKQLLPKRPDLKVIITSATIDTQRFAEHFTFNGVRPPVVEVSGRTYPVELRYRPLSSFEDDGGNLIEQEISDGILSALEELSHSDPFGDVLVFQVGERDIKETAEALRKAQLKNTEIVPLYARLSMNEQQKVFQTSQKRRVILSTNVAETSLTVPGIKYVIDPGLVRISRYSVRNKIQRLPVEKISKASANQRKGRCGRVSEGICIRLYSEDDFTARADFTDPEIHRTSLASIILTMAQLDLGEVKHFPFIEAPNDKSINDGYRQLHELGALDDQRRLTPQGRQIAKLPVDPSIGKMVIEAQKNGVLAELIVIAAALSIQDPRDINQTTQQAARIAHKLFEDERSDFLFYLNLWHFYEGQRRHLTQAKLRKLCKTNFLSYIRMKEWHELTVQLEQNLKRIGLKVGDLHLFEEIKQDNQLKERLSDLHSQAVHRSLLAGLLGNVAMRDDEKSYLGARATKLFIHPSSSLYKRKPKWMLAGELVETSKLYARNNAVMDVNWVESLAKHLIKHTYSDAHWQKKTGQVGAYESITLYGLPIVNRRLCNYGPINPAEAHKLFLRHGLAEGQLESRAPFWKHNQALIADIERLESKLRRPDFLVDDDVLYEFYAQRVPKHIYNKPAFETWLKTLEQQNSPQLKALYLTQADLMKQSANAQWLADYPDQVQIKNQLNLAVNYHFEPDKARDGLVYHLPLSSLNRVHQADFDWLTPGLLKEKTAFYIKALPKQLRKQFIPAPQYADLILAEMSPQKMAANGQPERYLHQLVWALNRRVHLGHQKVSLHDVSEVVLPNYLQAYFVLEDDKGKPLAEGQSLERLKQDYLHLVEAKIKQHQHQHQQRLKQTPAEAVEGLDKKGALALASEPKSEFIERWDFGDLADTQSIKSQGALMQAYPALQCQDGRIKLTLMGDLSASQHAHGQAVLALIERLLADKEKYLQKKLPLQKACLCYAPFGTCQDLTQQVIDRALAQLVHQAAGQPHRIRTQAGFETMLEQVRLHWIETALMISAHVNEIFTLSQIIGKQVRGKVNPRWLASVADIKAQLDALVAKDFVRTVPDEWFKQIPRYLKAIQIRLQKIDLDPSKDQLAIRQLMPVLNAYNALANEPAYYNQPGLVELRWLIEELRISLFAQPMKTLMPISIARLEQKLKAL